MPSVSSPYLYPLSIQSSLSILGLQTAPSSLKELNKRYHLLALQHHPDKVAVAHADADADADSSAHATEKFKEINEAHKRVLAYFYPSSHDDTGGYNTDDTGYESILQLFIRGILLKGVGGVRDRGRGRGRGSDYRHNTISHSSNHNQGNSFSHQSIRHNGQTRDTHDIRYSLEKPRIIWHLSRRLWMNSPPLWKKEQVQISLFD